MKFAIVALAASLFSMSAHAYVYPTPNGPMGPVATPVNVLKCWEKFSKAGSPPVLSANIESFSKLSKVTLTSFDGNKYASRVLVGGQAVAGNLITSNRSPYRGNQDFLFPEFRLILPLKLDNETLFQIVKAAGENGVIIGSRDVDDPGSGTHYSTRLRCRVY